jgi:CRISPR-associated protein Cas2
VWFSFGFIPVPGHHNHSLATGPIFGVRLRIQYSVFECPLDELRYQNLRAELDRIIHHEDDQILFISLGPEKSSNPFRIEALGQPYAERSRVTII